MGLFNLYSLLQLEVEGFGLGHHGIIMDNHLDNTCHLEYNNLYFDNENHSVFVTPPHLGYEHNCVFSEFEKNYLGLFSSCRINLAESKRLAALYDKDNPQLLTAQISLSVMDLVCKRAWLKW